MHDLLTFETAEFLLSYGYLAVAAVILLESMGLPLPGETILVSAAVYAGVTGRMSIVLVVLAAAFGAVAGDNLGYLIGRRFGYPLLRRHGPKVGLTERRLKLGRYLFARHGGKIVFFGRFVAVLRTTAALLAGANGMGWRMFTLANAAGGACWATLIGGGAFVLGNAVECIAGPAGLALGVGALVMAVGGVLFVRRHEHRLADEAERALPGPLDAPARG